jgi:glycogen operon protein
LPTLAGWWHGDDIAEESALGRIDGDTAAAQRAARVGAKQQLLSMLRAEGLLDETEHREPPLAAIHALIARTPAALALVQADDLACERVALNLPGTDRERPNWRRRIGCTAAAFTSNAVLEAIRLERT